MLALLLVWSAQAELPPPDYRAAVTEAAAAEVARRAREGGMEPATTFAETWARQIGPSAEVAYEIGLAWRLAGDDARARVALDEAVRLDPTHVAARYDRGELLLTAGDLDAAEVDFREVVRLGPEAWPGHFRLADVAARRGDAAGFERELTRALGAGWNARLVVGDPRWRDYLADPTLGPVLRRLVTVYQDERILDELSRP